MENGCGFKDTSTRQYVANFTHQRFYPHSAYRLQEPQYLQVEDSFNFQEQLADIKVPTLMIGGKNDGFYSVQETATGIP